MAQRIHFAERPKRRKKEESSGARGRRHVIPPSANGVNGHADAATTRPEAPPAPPPLNTVATVDGRGADGRFTPGNRAAAGNPFHRQVAARRKALLDAVSAEDVAAVAHKLRDMALAGDAAAAKVLLAYVVGKPAPAPDPDRLDLDEFRLLCEFPKLMDAEGACARVAPALAVVQAVEKLATDPQGYIRLLKMRMAELVREMLGKPGGREALEFDPDPKIAALADLDDDDD